jgi:hypothetical protein
MNEYMASDTSWKIKNRHMQHPNKKAIASQEVLAATACKHISTNASLIPPQMI